MNNLELLHQAMRDLEQARRDQDWLMVNLYASAVARIALQIHNDKVYAKMQKPHHD